MKNTVDTIKNIRAGKITSVIILFFITIFAFRTVSPLIILWNEYQKIGASHFLQYIFLDTNREITILLILNLFRMLLLSFLLFHFLRIKKWAYIALLSWTSFALGIELVTYFVTGEKNLNLLWGLLFGILSIFSLLQKNLYRVFDKKQ